MKKLLILFLSLVSLATQAQDWGPDVAANNLSPLTRAYQANIIAAGGTIDRQTLNEFDVFEKTGIRDGWMGKWYDFGVPAGSNLAAARVKFVTVTAQASLVNSGSIAAAESDYSQGTGIVLTTNTGKKFATGFVPTANGLSSTNFTIAYQAGVSYVEQSSYIIGTVPTSTTVDSPVRIVGQNAAIGNVILPAPQYDYDIIVGSLRSDGWSGLLNGLKAVGKSSVATGADISTEINLFSARRQNNVEYPAKGSLLMYGIGAALTDAEAKSFSLAMMRLTKAIRRTGQTGLFAGIGDSITKGAGTTFSSNGNGVVWSEQFAQKLGLRHVSAAQGSSQLRQDDTNGGYIGYFNKYLDLYNWPELPQVATLSYGVNDSNNADGTSTGDATIISDYGTKLETIIRANQQRRIRTLVCSISYNTSTNATDTKRRAWVVRAAAAAKATFSPFCDFNYLFLDEPDPSIYFASGDASRLHPNDLGNRLMSNQAWEAWQGRLTRRPTLDFPSIAAGAVADIAVEIFNADIGMTTTVTPAAAIESGLSIQSFVSAANTVTVRVTNNTAAAIDPAAARFKITAFSGL